MHPARRQDDEQMQAPELLLRRPADLRAASLNAPGCQPISASQVSPWRHGAGLCRCTASATSRSQRRCSCAPQVTAARKSTDKSAPAGTLPHRERRPAPTSAHDARHGQKTPCQASGAEMTKRERAVFLAIHRCAWITPAGSCGGRDQPEGTCWLASGSRPQPIQQAIAVTASLNAPGQCVDQPDQWRLRCCSCRS